LQIVYLLIYFKYVVKPLYRHLYERWNWNHWRLADSCGRTVWLWRLLSTL